MVVALPSHPPHRLNMGNTHSTPSSSELRATSLESFADVFKLGQSYDWSTARSQEIHYSEKHSVDHPSLKCGPKSLKAADDEEAGAYKAFLKAFPEYQLTSTLDDLRKNDFSRLDRVGETYVDYMGGGLYPESLIRYQTAFLNNNVLGNTHSINNR